VLLSGFCVPLSTGGEEDGGLWAKYVVPNYNSLVEFFGKFLLGPCLDDSQCSDVSFCEIPLPTQTNEGKLSSNMLICGQVAIAEDNFYHLQFLMRAPATSMFGSQLSWWCRSVSLCLFHVAAAFAN
jgi:hypothetical protein